MKFGFLLPKGLKLQISFSDVEIVIVYAVELRLDISLLRIEDQRHTSGVMRRVAHKNSNTSSVRPFIMRLLRLERVIQYVND